MYIDWIIEIWFINFGINPIDLPISRNTLSMIIGEDKIGFNLIACAKIMNMPKELNIFDLNGIMKPYMLGNNYGLERGSKDIFPDQEFIPRFDTTAPIYIIIFYSTKAGYFARGMHCRKNQR